MIIIKVERETRIAIEKIVLENEKILVSITLNLQLELEAEVEKVTIYYVNLFRDEEEKQLRLFLRLVGDLEAHYILEIEGLNGHYIGVVVQLEAEWNLKIAEETERIR